MRPITHTAAKVAAALREMAPGGTPHLVSTPDLAAATGSSERAVRYALADLEELGVITRSHYGPARTITIDPAHPLWALLAVMSS